MPRVTKPLTNTQIEAARPRDKVYTLSDGGGLQLRVWPNGHKAWLLDYYHPHTKKRTCLSFGAYPAVSLAAARERRNEAKELLSRNIDPKDHREEQQRLRAMAEQNTLRHIAEQWFEVKKSKVSSGYAEDIWSSLELHIFPKLGTIPIHAISATQVIDVIKPLEAKGSLETVKRVCQRLNEIMGYAENTDIIQRNRIGKIKEAFQRPEKQNQPALKPDQLPELMQALSVASIKRTTRCLIEWQLHTMVRPGEAAGAQWSEIDFDKRLWKIPAERMKTKKAHVVPLTEQTLALLDVMHPISGKREHIFPSDNHPQKHINPSTANMALKRMGFGGKLVAHGLRSIASTTLNEAEFRPDIIEAALAHIGGDEVRNAYNRTDYLEKRKIMMQWWSDHIENAGEGNFSISKNRNSLKIVRITV